MKWQTCFNSKCESGYDISVIKSAMQKFLRRRMPSEMKWCVFEMYKFKTMASNENEEKIGKAILSNLINRLIIMMDEELLFVEWHIYLKCRNLINIFINDNNINYLYELCDMLCEAKLLRYSSDVSCYFIKAVIGCNPDCNYNEDNIIDVNIIFKNFKNAIENNLIEESFYWTFVLFINKNEIILEKKVLKRNKPIYLVWDYLLKSEKVKNNENLKKSIEYRLEEFHKDRNEKKMYIVSALSLYLYYDKINWNIEWNNHKVHNNYPIINDKIEIPSFAIDMHCKEGRILGKNHNDFANEGSIVINEDKEYYNDKYRKFYVKCKAEDAENLNKINKNTKINKKKVCKKTEKNKLLPKKKKLLIIEDDNDEEEIIMVPKKKVIKENNKEKYIAKLPSKNELEFISMNDMKFVRLCLVNPCGGKVMCFVVEYKGKEYVLKEGRKSMNYNEDYEVVDNMKEIFGLNKIGMKRILSDKIMEKVNKSKKEWIDNWHFIEKENVVYSMMECINGVKFNKIGKINKEMELEYMKIGLFRGIFMVSDFNVTNVLVVDNKLYSIDEHDILGKREKMIGDKNMRFYKKYNNEIENIFIDLYENKEDKKIKILDVLKKYNYEKFKDKVFENYDNLRNNFYKEYNL
jgi:hypothetical protein